MPAALTCHDEIQRAGRKADASRGFTLLEVLIALVLLALMLSVLFASFRLSVNSYTRSQERIHEEAQRRALLDLARRQIGSLFAARPAPGIPFATLAEVGEVPQSVPLAITDVPLFHGTPESVTFITLAPLFIDENPGMAVVRYGLSQDEQSRYYLGAMESRFLGLESFIHMADLPQGKPLPLIEGIWELRFEYYGYDPERKTYDWFDSWSGDQIRAVPAAIRIRYNDNALVVPINARFRSGTFQEGQENPLMRAPQALIPPRR